MVAQQPGFRFVNSEVLTEARVANLALQLGFGPSTLRIRGQVRRKFQAGTVQIEKADDRNQPAGVQIPLGPLGEALPIVAAPRESDGVYSDLAREPWI